MDLSSPEGYSVNDGISKEDCSFHYTSVDAAVSRIVQLGAGSLLAKMDIQHAYRNIPVAPGDRQFLGLSWQGQIYIDKVLPFGLRSAPVIFSAVADALLWMMRQRGVSWAIHYVDDFLTIGSPKSSECQTNMALMHETCTLAGLPLEPSKTLGPLSTITFLGIELDSTAMEIRLPQEKLIKTVETITHWRGLKACKKRDLSLIGTLAHASKVIKSSRIFLRRLIDIASIARSPSHFIRLNAEAKSDIEWWFQFIRRWNGKSMLPLPMAPSSLVTDASGSWGCGAYWEQEWFQLQWSGMLANAHISVKELTPVVLSVALWGKAWKGRRILVLSDNSSTVASINKLTSRVRESGHLLRCLAFLTAHHQCELIARHMPGKHNTLADALSRDNAELFRHLHPQAQPNPTPIPEELLQLVIMMQPDWTSQCWTELWTSILMQDWLRQPQEHTERA